MEILDKYKNEYEECSLIEETNLGFIYNAYNKKAERECCLKIISKKQLQLGDYDFLYNQLNREETITNLCNSEYTVNFYRRLETKDNIIFELEYCDDNLNNYLNENGELKSNLESYKNIIISLAKALKTLHDKGVMHRDIKPGNIFYKDEPGNMIKLGDFGCSILIKDNKSEPIGTIFYTAPEIIKNFEYDERCDLWSLGITLFELYFGLLPYGNNPNTNKINKVVYGKKKLILKKTNIPTLDILFQRLLVINPKDRMTYDEFFKYVFSDNFMKEGVTYVNDNKLYKEIYEIILKEPEVNFENVYQKECKPKEEIEEQENFKKILTLVEDGHLPDLMNFPNGSLNENKVYNNIIYYDENIDYLSSIIEDSDDFERVTPGAFILCTKIESLNLIKEEILRQIEKDKKTRFNLITTGSKCEKIMKFLENNKPFNNCIDKICVYCMEYDTWSFLKDKYEKIFDVYTDQDEVIDFINKFSSKDIKPFPITKLLTLQDYVDKYKDRHLKISSFYGEMTVEEYKKNIKKMGLLIDFEGNQNLLVNSDKNDLMSGFLTFDLSKDLEHLDNLIIKEYTKNTFYGDLNKWLMNSKMNFYEPVAYFTARLMFSLNKFAKKNKKYCNEDKKELHRGIKIPYSDLIAYERAKGKIILLSAFTSTSKDKEEAESFAGREETKSLYNNNLKFSVVLHITNIYKNGWISNGIDIEEENDFEEKEILFQPFSFYYVKNTIIDIEQYTAEIYLETIGKIEILEEKIKLGKEIEYNEDKKIMEVKN